MQVQKGVYLCFVDYANAFYKVNRNDLCGLRGKHGLFGKYREEFKIYTGQKTRRHFAKNELSMYTKTCVRQEYDFSNGLLKDPIETKLKDIDVLPKYNIGE